MVAASEISKPGWSRVTTNLNINAIAGGGVGGGSALHYVMVSLGKVRRTHTTRQTWVAPCVVKRRAVEQNARASTPDSLAPVLLLSAPAWLLVVVVLKVLVLCWCRCHVIKMFLTPSF